MEVKLKPSRYNLIAEDTPERFLAANTLTGALISLGRHAMDEVARVFDSETVHPGTCAPELLSLLRNNGFVVPYSLDELALLKERHWTARNGSKALGLAVGVTQRCNFACVYCYQYHQPVDLSYEAQQAIVAYVKRELPPREVLKTVWWGGEPLLRLDMIEKLSGDLRNLCNRYGCEYEAAITTNGYLLSASVAERLVRLGVHDVQVTLDGPPEVHDRRRYLRGGQGSFNRIFQNLCASAPQFDRLVVRTNVDRRNAESIESLIAILEPIKQWVVLAIRAATSPESPDHPSPWCLPAPDYWVLEDELAIVASRRGFRLSFGYPIPGTSFCAGYQRNAITVDAYGDVHRCPVCVGRRHDRVGILNGDGMISDTGGPQLEWDNWSPFEDFECRECVALPVCMGGCLWYLRTPKVGSLRCFAKHRLVERMKLDATLADWARVGEASMARKEVSSNVP